MRGLGVLGSLKAQRVLDIPSTQLAAAIVGGLGIGGLLAAVSAGVNSLGEAGLQALGEAKGRDSNVADRILADLTAVQSRLLVGRVLCVALAAAFVAYWLLLAQGAGAALSGVLGISAAYAVIATVASAVVRRRSGQATLRVW